jgi:hypothetical protein
MDGKCYAITNLIIIVTLYNDLYEIYKQRYIYHTYIVYKPPLNWKEYFKVCKTDEGKYIPYCLFFKDT